MTITVQNIAGRYYRGAAEMRPSTYAWVLTVDRGRCDLRPAPHRRVDLSDARYIAHPCAVQITRQAFAAPASIGSE